MNRRAPDTVRPLVFAALASPLLMAAIMTLTGWHSIPLTFTPAGLLLPLAYWRHTHG